MTDKQILSNVVTLGGTIVTQWNILATNHHADREHVLFRISRVNTACGDSTVRLAVDLSCARKQSGERGFKTTNRITSCSKWSILIGGFFM